MSSDKTGPYGSKFGTGPFWTDAATDTLANWEGQRVEITHIPSGHFVAFKAALTTFTDSFQSDWNQSFVFGRMDPIGTYKRTTRSMQIGFSVAAYGYGEAKNNLGRLSLLSQMMYPSFDSDTEGEGATMRGSPLVQIKFLNWAGVPGGAEGLLGWIDGVTFAPDLSAGTFSHESDDSDNAIFPKKFDITFRFVVLHSHQLGWNNDKQATLGGKKVLTANQPFFPYSIDVDPNSVLPDPPDTSSTDWDHVMPGVGELFADMGWNTGPDDTTGLSQEERQAIERSLDNGGTASLHEAVQRQNEVVKPIKEAAKTDIKKNRRGKPSNKKTAAQVSWVLISEDEQARVTKEVQRAESEATAAATALSRIDSKGRIL